MSSKSWRIVKRKIKQSKTSIKETNLKIDQITNKMGDNSNVTKKEFKEMTEKLTNDMLSQMKELMKEFSSQKTEEKSDGTISRTTSTNSLKLADIKQEETFNIKHSLAISLHPYMKYLYWYGHTGPEKDICKIDDYILLKCIMRWVLEEGVTPHIKCILFLISRLPSVYNLNAKSNAEGTVFVRTLNAIDLQIQQGVTLNDSQVSELLNDFKEVAKNEKFVKFGTNSNNRSSFKTCFKYNEQGGCSYKSCRYQHLCSKHAALGKRAEHSAFECRIEENG